VVVTPILIEVTSVREWIRQWVTSVPLLYSWPIHVAIIVVFVIVVAQSSKFVTWWLHREPEMLLLKYLLFTLYAIEEHPAEWGERQFRQRLLRYLEIAATALQRQLPRRLRAGDPVYDAWSRERSRQLAMGLREFKPWVLTPGSTTRNDLKRELGAYIANIATDCWDALPRNTAKQFHEQRWTERLRYLIYAIGCFVLLWITQTKMIALGDAVEPYFTIGVLVAMGWNVMRAASRTSEAPLKWETVVEVLRVLTGKS
jgi:hypothetical protein